MPPVRGSLQSAETFISEARGGALSFPGFNGDSRGPHMGQRETLFNVFYAAFEDRYFCFSCFCDFSECKTSGKYGCFVCSPFIEQDR